MENTYLVAAFWFLAAVISTIIARQLKISVALMDILLGSFIGFLATNYGYFDKLGLQEEWMKFLTGIGAVLLTFLAGAELNPATLKSKFKEVTLTGFVGFAAPFAGSTLIAYYLVGWDLRASLLTGIALSTTSMAVVYAVMLEYGFNKTPFGKGILGACFVNDIGTVIALGLIFSPFTYKTIVFISAIVAVSLFLPALTRFITTHFAFKTFAVRTKWFLFVLLGFASLALWAGSEPVLPAYILGMVASRILESDEQFLRRFRTLTVGFLTPLYFLRAGAFIDVPILTSAPLVFLILLGSKVFSKIFGLYPTISLFVKNHREKWYYTLLMSTGLTFGTISALFGLTHQIITQEQYSYIVSVVIASAVIPTLIANKFFLPSHLLETPIIDDQAPDVYEIKHRTILQRAVRFSYPFARKLIPSRIRKKIIPARIREKILQLNK